METAVDWQERKGHGRKPTETEALPQNVDRSGPGKEAELFASEHTETRQCLRAIGLREVSATVSKLRVPDASVMKLLNKLNKNRLQNKRQKS